MLAALGTSGTLPWRRNGGTGHLWAPGHGRPEKGVCVLGPVPWALSGTSQGGGRQGRRRKEPPLHPMVPGLQGSRSAQARFPRSAEPDIVSMSISLSLSMSMSMSLSLISLE